MRAFVLVALLCLSVACEEDRPRALGAPYDAGPGGAQATTSRCPTFTGFDRVGRSWRIESTDAYEAEYAASFFQESTVLEIADLGDHAEVEVSLHTSVSGTIPQGNYTFDEQGTIRFRCDAAGLALLEEDTSTELRLANDTSTELDRKSYEPALLLLPAELRPHMAWTGRAEVTHVHETDGVPRTETFEVVEDSSTVEQGPLTTPAGTFTVWSVNTTQDDGITTTYWADGVGRVGDDVGRLVAYE